MFTTGVEIEAVLHAASVADAREKVALPAVANAIIKAGAVARVWLPTSLRAVPNFEIWNVTTDATISEMTSGSDGSSQAVMNRCGLEITSPTFNTEKDPWQDEIKKVLDHLQSTFTLRANRSTGLHVHVGLVDGYALGQVKRIAKLVIKYEATVDSIHAGHRSVLVSNENIMSNRNNAILAPLTEHAIFGKIDEATSPEAVTALVNHSGETDAYDGYSDAKFYKVNFTSLRKYGTIEFRQHSGTLDADVINHWVSFVLRFIKIALKATDHQISAATATKDGLNDLAVLIGVDGSA